MCIFGCFIFVCVFAGSLVWFAIAFFLFLFVYDTCGFPPGLVWVCFGCFVLGLCFGNRFVFWFVVAVVLGFGDC